MRLLFVDKKETILWFFFYFFIHLNTYTWFCSDFESTKTNVSMELLAISSDGVTELLSSTTVIISVSLSKRVHIT